MRTNMPGYTRASMGVAERLLLRCDGRVASVEGGLPELELDVALQDSLVPLCRAASELADAPVVLTVRLLSPGGNLNVVECSRATAALSWSSPEVLDDWLDADQRAALQGGGAPWYDADYHARLLGFAEQVRRELGAEAEGPPEQVRVSPLSCIYRLPRRGGDHWLKATRPRAFVPEGPVMAALARAFPGRVPAPLATGPDVALFEDFGPRMDAGTPNARVAEAASALAHMQLDDDAELPLADMQSWRLCDLRADLEGSASLGPGRDAFLDAVEARSRELEAFGIGDRLAHGDFYWGNLAAGPKIFDWSDAALGHPFFDPMEALYGQPPERREAVREAYLGVWRAALGTGVDAAWGLASRLLPAHHLARNERLLSHLEPWERPCCAPQRDSWARTALASIDG